MASAAKTPPSVPAPAPTSTAIPLVAGARLPLAFVAIGLACYAAIALLLFALPGTPLQPRSHTAALVLVHLWLPGFLMSACIGATYQLMPVIVAEPLRGEKLAWSHLWLHLAGLTMLLGGFAANNFQIVSIGGTLVGLGVIFFAINIVRTFLASTRRDATAWSFVFAALWLVLTVSVGVTLAHNRFYPRLSWPLPGLLQAHAHLGLCGFFLSLLQGAAFQLMPMFMLAQERHKYLAGVGVTGVQTGLLFLIPGLALDDPLIIGSGVILFCAGILCSAAVFIATFETRKKSKLESGLRAFVLGSALILLATFAGIALLIQPHDAAGPFAPDTPEAGAAAYIALIVILVLGLIVPGMLCKIAPFLVWMRTYGPRIGRAPVPPAHTLGSAKSEAAWLILHIIGGATLFLGLWTANATLVRFASFALAAAALSFLGSMFCIARHYHKPQLPRPNPARPISKIIQHAQPAATNTRAAP